MKAVILAGGEGSRLGDRTRRLPKPMVPVGGAPILEHQVRLLARYGYTDILLLIGRLGTAIREHFGNGSRFGVHIAYHEEDKPLGTTGGVKANEQRLTDDFLLLYGDIVMDMDLPALVAFHRNQRADATLVLHPNDHPHDSDLAEVDSSGRIVAFHGKPHPPGREVRNLVNAAVYVLSPRILATLEPDVKADFGRDIFPRIAGRCRLFGYRSAEYIKDVGTPQRLAEVDRDLREGRVARRNRERPQRAVFLDRDGVLNRWVNLLHRKEDLELLPGVPDAVRRLNTSDHLAVVATNQSVVARNLCSPAELEQIHARLESLLGRQGAYLDAIYACPHHPDKGYPEENPAYKVPCTCRKPGTGMLEQAATAFHIDLAQSCFIGDTWRDVATAHAAGMPGYAVRTGDTYGRTEPRPDGVFDTLGEAVDYALARPYAEVAAELADQALERAAGTPAVVAVGGQARAGKTLVSSELAWTLRKRGVGALVVSLDDWLVPAEERTLEMGVFERFRLETLAQDLTALLQEGQPVTAPGYDARSRGGGEARRYALTGETVVILDGVVALAPALHALTHLRVWVEADEAVLRHRFERFYAWKGLDGQAIEAIRQRRRGDEVEPIGKTRAYAHRIVENAG